MSYGSQHRALRRARGVARGYYCVCGKRADEWAYQGGCPDEQRDIRSTRWAKIRVYCPHPEHYRAMCLSCHHRKDRVGTHCKRGHPKTPGNTRRNGTCRPCARDRKRVWARADRARKAETERR